MPRNANLYLANGGWRGARADSFDAGEDVDPRSNFAMFQRKLLDTCGIDLAIRYSRAPEAGRGAIRLFGEQVMPAFRQATH